MLGGMVVDVRTFLGDGGKQSRNSTLVAKIDRSGTKKIMSVFRCQKKKRNGEENLKKWIAS